MKEKINESSQIPQKSNQLYQMNETAEQSKLKFSFLLYRTILFFLLILLILLSTLLFSSSENQQKNKKRNFVLLSNTINENDEITLLK